MSWWHAPLQVLNPKGAYIGDFWLAVPPGTTSYPIRLRMPDGSITTAILRVEWRRLWMHALDGQQEMAVRQHPAFRLPQVAVRAPF